MERWLCIWMTRTPYAKICMGVVFYYDCSTRQVTFIFFLSTILEVSDFGHFYDTCEKFRITSVTLSIIGETIGNPGGFNKEQCSLLVKLLKPVNVFIISTRSNRFEALLGAKQMVSINYLDLHF